MADADPRRTAEERPAVDRAFLWLRSIDGFDAIDDQHVVLNSGGKHALVTTFGFCFGSRSSEAIVIDAPLPYVDKAGLGFIIYRRGPYDRGRCPIDHVEAVRDLKEAGARVALEKAEKAAANGSR